MNKQTILREMGFSEKFIQELQKKEKYPVCRMEKIARYEKINTHTSYYSSEIDL